MNLSNKILLSKNIDIKRFIIILPIALLVILTIKFLKNIYIKKKNVKEQFTNYL